MKVIGINGSPRKKWNTAQVLQKALDGAAAQGAETELVHLYEVDFKGCTSCFACKLKGGTSYGKCAMRDGLTPVLEKIAQADALVLGSPVYFGRVSGEMCSFLERLLFQYFVYSQPPASLFGRRIRTAFIYTMNVPETLMREMNYAVHIGGNENYLARIFGGCETLCCNETVQFDDYGKYVFNYFDPEQRRQRHSVLFPENLQKAFELGQRLVSP
ncbi:flavodoxin family protein [Geomonas subterranea]|uniref:Flavodoxin family protein n=1 Tax=Geomonas subterranea TaxID=2847989 RepID=A0ABX8LEK9_9BACT|nr:MULTISPECIES: flavodoxin family protein [Geomonas]QXE90107.1 flavodoxin family protein [Geomonas subterranea]QXM07769.1 flavodoxin family protein [Geomonas subterranea]